MVEERNVDVQVPNARGSYSAASSPPRRGAGRKRVLLVLQYYDYRHHSGVARYAAEAGWALEDAYTMVRGLPHAWDGDGIVSFHGPSAEFVDWLKAARVPVVDIGEYDQFSDFPRVTTDGDRIARLAMDHFVEQGYRNVGFAWAFDNAFKAKRLAAARRAADDRGLTFFDVQLDQIAALPGQGALPVALLAANDGTAVRALRACEDAGLLVPEQVAILGVDNFEYRCVPASVPLSSIDADQERLGYEAAAMLDRLMNGQREERTVVEIPPVGIVRRASTDMRAVADVEVARALRFVISNFRRRLTLNDVAAATNLSLRRLQTRFKEQLGRTILQEINGRRVRHAQELLKDSNLKIRAVAGECGFGGSVKLIRVFKQYVGTSPKRYRKEVRKAEAATGVAEG
jgi:LacI family transcriptional regulator